METNYLFYLALGAPGVKAVVNGASISQQKGGEIHIKHRMKKHAEDSTKC